MNTSMKENLQAGRASVEAGYPVFPVGPDKKPLIKDWQRRATTDLKQLERWQAKWPDAMPAIPTGSRSGVVVLDVDKKNGKDGFKALVEMGFDVDTLSPVQIETPSGGRHIYFRWEEGMGNSAKGLPPGLDIRGEGGLVVAPGAANGVGVYETLSGKLTIGDVPMPEALKPHKRRSEPGDGDPTGLPFDVIVSALDACPNDGDEYASRDAWLAIGMALHCETGGGEEGCEAWHAWSGRWPGFDADDTDHAWESFKADKGVTGWHIIHEAERHGWSNPAVADLRHLDALDDLDAAWRLMDWTPEVVLDPEEEAGIAELVGPVEPPLFAPASAMAGRPVPQREWLVDQLIPGNTVTLLSGDGGTGKSLLALQLAVATVMDKGWVGRDVERSGKVLFLSAEDDDAELHRRLADICRESGVSMSALGDLLLRSMAGEDALMAVLDRKTNALRATKLYAALCATMERERPALLVLDTLADLHAGNENDRAHGRQFIGMLRHLAIEFGCSVLLLAHPSLTGLNSGSGTSGSTAWSNSVRSRLYLRRVTDDGREPDADARILQTMKSNYGKTGEEIGLTWTSGVFITDKFQAEDRNVKAERVFLNLLNQLAKQGRKVSAKPSSMFAPKVFSEMPGNEGVSKKALQRAMESLLGREVVRVEEEGPPSKRRSYLVGASQ